VVVNRPQKPPNTTSPLDDMTRDNALVYFGASRDLAYRKIFLALHNLARRGVLAIRVIGVAGTSRTK